MRKLMVATLTGAALIAGLTGCTVGSGESTPQPSATSTPATHAPGTPVTPAAGLPAVTLDGTGKPTVTIPDTTPPTTKKVAVVKQGDGTIVKDGDWVTAQYQIVNWDTKKVVSQSWGREPAALTTGGVIRDALVGHKVGSQVMVVIPPKDRNRPTAQTPPGIKATDTLVVIIDILAIKTTK
jgi:hypothetical protein